MMVEFAAGAQSALSVPWGIKGGIRCCLSVVIVLIIVVILALVVELVFQSVLWPLVVQVDRSSYPQSSLTTAPLLFLRGATRVRMIPVLVSELDRELGLCGFLSSV
jgi:hypothetical protein